MHKESRLLILSARLVLLVEYSGLSFKILSGILQGLNQGLHFLAFQIENRFPFAIDAGCKERLFANKFFNSKTILSLNDDRRVPIGSTSILIMRAIVPKRYYVFNGRIFVCLFFWATTPIMRLP